MCLVRVLQLYIFLLHAKHVDSVLWTVCNMYELGIDMVQTCFVHVFGMHIQEQIFEILYIHSLDMYIQLSRCI